MQKMRLLTLIFVSVLALSSGSLLQGGPRRAVVNIAGRRGVSGKVILEQVTPSSPVKIRGKIEGLPVGRHAINIHESGDISGGCARVGSHFNPTGQRHGALTDAERHAGDLGTVKSTSGAPNRADLNVISPAISLFEESPRSVLGLSLVIYGEDVEDVAPIRLAEAAGSVLGCGVISQTGDVESRWEDIARVSGASFNPKSAGMETDWGSKVKNIPLRGAPKPWASKRWESSLNPSQPWESAEESSGRVRAPAMPSRKIGSSEWSEELEASGKVASNLDIEGVETPDYKDTVLPFRPSPASTSRIWKVGNTYEYDYIGWLATGMNAISPQMSGASISGRFIVEPKDQHTLLLALVNTRSKIFNDVILEKWEDADPGQDAHVMRKELVETPFVVKMSAGKVESVAIGADEPLWVANFKRGLAAQVQLQLDQSSAVFSDAESDAFYSKNGVYTVMEGCTTGECQTYYHFSKVPDTEVEVHENLVPQPDLCAGKNVYEIVKNRDFNKCKILPIYNNINVRDLQCNLAEFSNCENAISRLDMVRVIGCVATDGSFLVQKIKVLDKLITKPFAYETEPIEGHSVQRFNLRDVRKSSAGLENKLSSNVEVFKTLVYAYDEDLKTHGPYMNRPSLREVEIPIVQEPKRENLIKEIVRLMKDIVNDLDSDEFYVNPVGKFTPDKINMMRVAMSYLDYDDLKALTKNLMSPDPSSTENQIFLDALVAAGSNPAVVIVQELIAMGKVSKQRAIQAIATLPATIKTPTKELLSTLLDFLNSQIVASSRQLKITTALALTQLIDKACVNTTDSFNSYPEMTMGQFCSPDDEIVNSLIEWLTEELNESADNVDKMAMLAALSNLGHEAIIPTVLPYITSCDPSTEEEFNFMERERRAVRDEKKLDKKALLKKYLRYKKLKSRLVNPKEEEEDEHYWSKASKWEKKVPRAVSKSGKPWKELIRRRLEKLERVGMPLPMAKSAGVRKTAFDVEESAFRSSPFKSASKSAFEPEEEFDEYEEEINWADELQWAEGGSGKFTYYPKYLQDLKYTRKSLMDLNIEDLEASDLEEEETDEAMCNLIRTKAVYALTRLSMAKSESVLPVLFPISFNKDEDTQVRLAALSLLFLHELPAGFWSRVAASTWFEPNDHISSFVYTTIASLALNKDPKRRIAATKAEAVMPLVKPIRWAPHLSFRYVNADYEERTRLGYLLKTVNIGGYESFMPAIHMHRFRTRVGPYESKLLETVISGVQMEELIDQIIGEPTRRWKSAAGVYGAAAEVKKGLNPAVASPELMKIHQDLNIEARASGNPEMFIKLNFLDNYQRFYHFDANKIQQAVSSVVRSAVLRQSGSLTTNYQRYSPYFDKIVRVPSAMGLAYGIWVQAKQLTSVKTSAAGSMDLAATTSVNGVLQSVVAIKIRSKMTVEAAFVRALPTCGVDVSIKVAVPGKFRLAGDYKRGKVEASWMFLGDRVRVGHYSVTPYTTVRSVEDFTPSMLLKETKLVTLLDTLKESKMAFGARETGLNLALITRHDAKALHTPYAFTRDLIGLATLYWVPSSLRLVERELVLDVANSDTDVIKFSVDITAKHHTEIETMAATRCGGKHHGSCARPGSSTPAISIWNNIMDAFKIEDSFNRPVRPFGRSFRIEEEESEEDQAFEDQWTMEKFSKVFEKLENPVGFSVDMSAEFLGGSGSGRTSRKFSKSSGIEDLLLENLLKGPFAKAHRYGGSFNLGMDAYGFSQRSHLLLRKELEHATEENFVLCAEWNMDYPKALSVMREKFITDDMTTAGSIDIGFGKSCTNDRKITIQTEFKRSDAPSFAKSASAALEEAKCIKDEIKGQGVSESCLSTRRLAAITNKAIITVNYNQMPLPLQNLTSKAENILRHWFGAYLSDNQVNVQNKPGEIRIEAVYHPVIGTMDVRNYKPQSNTFFHNIEVNPIAEAIVPFHARLSAYRAAFGGPGLCYVGPRTVTTFDGLNYNASLSGCDHVIAKDCSARYKMAVLAREEGNKKIVTVLLNKEKIEINPAAIAVRINNVDQSISGRKMHVVDDLKQIIATVRHTPDGFIEVVSPTHWIKVTVNPKEVIIMSSPVHRGRMCGLCGTQSGDKTDDLTGPRKCSLPSDLMDVAYQINRPSGCKSYSVSSNRIAQLRQIQQTCSVEPFNPLTRTTGYQSKLGSMWKRDLSFAEQRWVGGPRSGPVSPFGPSGPVSPFGPSGPVSPVGETSWIPDEYSLPMQPLQGFIFGGKRTAPQCTVLRNRQVFRNGMRCYSITALPKCAQGCRPVGTTTRKLGFHCLARGRLTEHLNKELQVRPLDEMSNKEIHVMQSYKIPTGCAPAL